MLQDRSADFLSIYTHYFKMRSLLERPFDFFIDFVIEMSYPPMEVWIIVADHFPITVEDCVVCHVKSDCGWKEPILYQH